MDREKKDWQSWYVADGKALGPLLEFLKATEVGGREGAREREREWERQNDHAGEDLLSDGKTQMSQKQVRRDNATKK